LNKTIAWELEPEEFEDDPLPPLLDGAAAGAAAAKNIHENKKKTPPRPKETSALKRALDSLALLLEGHLELDVAFVGKLVDACLIDLIEGDGGADEIDQLGLRQPVEHLRIDSGFFTDALEISDQHGVRVRRERGVRSAMIANCDQSLWRFSNFAHNLNYAGVDRPLVHLRSFVHRARLLLLLP
jgi:hypothetical protein